MSISTKYSHSEFVFVGKFLTRKVLNIDASICCPLQGPLVAIGLDLSSP